MIGWLLAILLGLGGMALAVALLTWSDVETWTTANRQANENYADVIGKMLTDGRYRVVANVFTNGGVQSRQQIWEAAQISTDLQSNLGTANRTRIRL
jgi:hypothetical protein